jgi:hypothetical protein
MGITELAAPPGSIVGLLAFQPIEMLDHINILIHFFIVHFREFTSEETNRIFYSDSNPFQVKPVL